ncbi:DUF1285 domain-containing protein [Dongia sp.]|uniref:DUF1285 domain-containing protein n=1 Tax=Dongia sp. TaxID=1977262 RepID=UPI0035AFA6DF
MSNLDLNSIDFSKLPSCGDFDFRIARDGTWFYRGSPIGRKPLVRLFSTVLRRENDGSYWLVTPVERGRIVVDDAPFVAVEMTVTGAGEEQCLAFRTNVEDWVTADAGHPIRVAYGAGGEPSPYIRVRGALDALISRAVFYQLVDLAETREQDGSTEMGVWSGGAYFPLGLMEAA